MPRLLFSRRKLSQFTLASLLCVAAGASQNIGVSADPGHELASPAVLALNQRSARGELELELAADYWVGRSVNRDEERAAYWYRKAAQQGDPAAQVQIGYFYQQGVGVGKDAAEAARWYGLATASGYSPGELNLGVLYITGVGVRRDETEGFNLIARAAQQGYSFAEVYLGDLYSAGIGTGKDPAAAERLFREAAKQHNPEALYNLGMLFSIQPDHPHDYVKAARLLREAQGGGYSPSVAALGSLLVKHHELEQAPGEALEDLRAAASLGDWKCSALLAVASRDGDHTSVDRAEAYLWFRIAALQGGAQAEEITSPLSANVAEGLDGKSRAAKDAQAAEWAAQHPPRRTLALADPENRYFPGVVVQLPNANSSK